MTKLKTAIRVGFFLTTLSACTGGGDQFGKILDVNSGGTGNASIAITNYAPGNANVVLKDTASQDFVVVAVGQGPLLYQWTLDGTPLGGNGAAVTLNGPQTTVGPHELKLKISDQVGTVEQTWNVKVNGAPTLQAQSPAPAAVHLRRTTTQTYSVTTTDPNSDTLTYIWKLDGQEGVLPSTSNSTTWTPTIGDIGSHTIAVDIWDGPISDPGSYKITKQWTTYVNHFSDSCNSMENESQTNKTCVFAGISGIGDGLNPQTSASSFYLRPASLAKTASDGFFIGDDVNHVVWYYNLHTAPSETVLGVTVPVNTMKVVAGTGVASSGNSVSLKALRNFLNNPHGLTWDGTQLFISDTSNNRVLKVDADGNMSVVLSAGCSSPRGLAINGNYLYVACYSSNTIRRIDLTDNSSIVFAGTGAAGNPSNTNESSFTDATNGKLSGPYALALDADGNLYLGEHTGCRVRLYNLSGSTITLFGSYDIHANMQRLVVGPAGAPSCTPVSGEAASLTAAADARIGNARGLSFTSNGLLLIAHDGDAVTAVNFSAATTTFLGTDVTSYWASPVAGSGTAGYLGEGQVALTSRFNNPFAAIEDSTTGALLVADNGNLRLRKVRATDFKTELTAGNGNQRAATNAGQGSLEVGLEKMSGLRGFAYDKISGEVFVADSSNHRIRVINRFGISSQAIGTGSSGLGAEENEYPSNVTMNQPRGLVLIQKTASFGGHLVWADSQNHRIRLWNRGATTETFFGVTIDGGRIATIAGNGASGTATSGSALQAAFNNPGGVTSDGTNIYVADTNNHCIKKIDGNGDLSVAAGTCGTSGNVNGPVGSARLTSPEGIDYYENGAHKGLLIAARGNSRVKFTRLAGPSLLFGGSTSVGDTNSIACGGTFHTENVNANLAPCSNVYDVAAVGTKVCFTNYTYHNARCIEASGEINTILGGPEGIDDTTALYGPGGAFAAADFDSSHPNSASQNGITAALKPATVTEEPALTEAYGQVTYPISIRALDEKTVLVGEGSLGLIRKVKLP